MSLYRLLPLLLILCSVVPAFAQRDTLFFKNGSIVVGEVKEAKLGVIIFDPDDAGDITVQLRKLKALHASYRDFRMELVDHQVFIGTIYPSVHSGFANIALGQDTTLISFNNISFLYPVERSFWRKFNGYATAGYSYTRSSELGRLNFESNVAYLERYAEYNLYTSSISTIDEGDFSRDNENVTFGGTFSMGPTWFTGVVLSYQRNLELGIKRRMQEGVGIGNKLITMQKVRLFMYGGAVINQEFSTEGENSGILPEATIGIRFNIFSFEKPELDIETKQNGYVGFSQNRYRYDGNVSVRWEFINDFALSISFYTNYDSSPPGEITANYDYGTVLGLTIKF